MKSAVILVGIGLLALSGEAFSCYSTDPLAGQAGPTIEFRTDAKGARVAVVGGVEFRPVMDQFGRKVLGFNTSRWGWLGGEFILQPMSHLDAVPEEIRKALELIANPGNLGGQSALCDLGNIAVDLGYFGVHPLFGGQLQSGSYWRDSIIQGLYVGPNLGNFSGANCQERLTRCVELAKAKFDMERGYCEGAGILIGGVTAFVTRNAAAGLIATGLSMAACVLATNDRYDWALRRCEHENWMCIAYPPN